MTGLVFNKSIIINGLDPSLYLNICGANIDKVYIDGPFELPIRRSIDKLLAEHFCNQKIPGPSRTANILIWNSRAQTYCIRTVSIVYIY